jgi:hypothetical protein
MGLPNRLQYRRPVATTSAALVCDITAALRCHCGVNGTACSLRDTKLQQQPCEMARELSPACGSCSSNDVEWQLQEQQRWPDTSTASTRRDSCDWKPKRHTGSLQQELPSPEQSAIDIKGPLCSFPALDSILRPLACFLNPIAWPTSHSPTPTARLQNKYTGYRVLPLPTD